MNHSSPPLRPKACLTGRGATGPFVVTPRIAGSHLRLIGLTILVISLFFLFVPASPAGMRGPWGNGVSATRESLLQGSVEKGSGKGLLPGDQLGSFFTFYNRVLSSIDGRDCPCYPSCSSYAVFSVQKHGLILGTLFAIDRLIHEADEIHSKGPVFTPTGLKYFDPLEHNDFWLSGSGEDQAQGR